MFFQARRNQANNEEGERVYREEPVDRKRKETELDESQLDSESDCTRASFAKQPRMEQITPTQPGESGESGLCEKSASETTSRDHENSKKQSPDSEVNAVSTFSFICFNYNFASYYNILP